MGACLMLAAAPACVPTDERCDELEKALREVPAKEVCDNLGHTVAYYSFEDGKTDEEIKEFLIDEILGAFHNVREGRDCVSAIFPGMDYYMLVTGGMSWGDSPTDTYDKLILLECLPSPCYDLLLKWARQDNGH